ncbi:hypothetical protein MBRA1_000402 [Malassezia brasiliensis]|uniref:Amino acid transporter transmembrane domain-containing protein n=1 Tax=Malassezia brasiliensis TaxID=1821822 RepID=A0AAF0IM77_9BASI|nr:hypothetical protein MBRA1_000402 [Malassezia brasiliensis]
MHETTQERRGAVALDEDGEEVSGSATILSSISGLTNTIIGAGMLALPHAYATMGWLLGTVLVLLCAMVTNFGLHLVKLCEVRMELRPQSFYDMTSQVMPSAVWYFDATIFVKLLWVVVSLVLVSPVCFYRKLHQMRWVGYLNMAAVLYLLVIMLYYFLSGTARAALPPRGEIAAVIFSTDVLRTFPIMVFAYTCAQNILPVYSELHHSTVKRSSIVTILSLGASAMVYVVVASVGYATFGAQVGDNIIAMYPSSSMFVSIGKLSVIALTLTSYPMQLYPCRASLINMLEVNANVLSSENTEESMLGPTSAEMDPVNHYEINDQRWSLLTLTLMTAGLLVSLLIDDLSIVLGIVGSVGSTTISFILPALLYRRMYDDEPNTTLHSSAFFLGIWGGAVLVLALFINISRIFQGM